MTRYGGEEYRYAVPIADALAEDSDFREWLLGKTEFAQHASSAVSLHAEQKARRNANAENWWRSYWTTKCACGTCGQRETDLLAVFQAGGAYRFALHIEIKSPGDRFGGGQALDYLKRARCWSESPPKTVLPHSAATTLLVCERRFAESNRETVAHFATTIFFDEISERLQPYPALDNAIVPGPIST